MTAALTTAGPSHELGAYKSLENDELAERIRAVKDEFGPRLLVLGHHYQQDEVIALADLTGDSYRLSQLAPALLVLTPHKRPDLRPAWGWTLTGELVVERVRLRYYRSGI